MEAGCVWCSTAIMVPLLNEAPILATGRWHGPLKLSHLFKSCCPLPVSSFEGLWVLRRSRLPPAHDCWHCCWRCCRRFAAAARGLWAGMPITKLGTILPTIMAAGILGGLRSSRMRHLLHSTLLTDAYVRSHCVEQLEQPQAAEDIFPCPCPFVSQTA